MSSFVEDLVKIAKDPIIIKHLAKYGYEINHEALESCQNVLTAQEWYHRFVKELGDKPDMYKKLEGTADNEDKMCWRHRQSGRAFQYDRALEAARRVAGINNLVECPHKNCRYAVTSLEGLKAHIKSDHTIKLPAVNTEAQRNV